MGRVLSASPQRAHKPSRWVTYWLRRTLCAAVVLAAAGWPTAVAADTAMSVPVVSQQDGAWAGVQLGSSPVDTIGSAGCAVSAVAMVLNYYGGSTNPAQLNAWLTANNGYATDDDVIWDSVSGASGGRVDFTGWYGADLGTVGNELDAGRPVIAEVSLYGNQHFVVLTGSAGSDFIINDPWFGDQVAFSSRYGDPSAGIVSIRTFAPRSPSGPRGAGGGPSPLASSDSPQHQAR
jgi:peptidase C39-like protein